MDDSLTRVLALPVPQLLIGSVVLVSLLGWLPAVRNVLILSPYRLWQRGQYYRLITAGWIHSDLWHLAANMLSLYFFAGQTVAVLGAQRFLLLYVSAVVVGFIPSVLRHVHHPTYGTLGASGGVAAVMLSAILLHPQLKLYLMFIPFPVSGIVFAVAYLLYSVWHSSGGGDGTNHEAHFSGALYGAILTWVFEPARVERSIHTWMTMKSLW